MAADVLLDKRQCFLGLFSHSGGVQMRTTTLIAAGAIAASLMAAAPASAQSSKDVEIGASLMNLSIVKPEGGGSNQTLFGMPSGTFGIGGPGVYATFFASQHIGIEPQANVL